MVLPTSASPTAWTLTYKEKKALLGTKGRVDCSGGNFGRSGRADSDLELMAFHGNSEEFWEEVLHILKPASVCEMGLLDVNVALAACKTGTKYTKITWTEEHQRGLPRATPQVSR